jgi:hypothetical protein
MGSQNLYVAGLVLATALVALSPVFGQAPSPIIQQRTEGQAGEAAPPNVSGTLTGKERLGRKWSDEQRLDNCNVPIDKRGTRPRPSACVHAPTI